MAKTVTINGETFTVIPSIKSALTVPYSFRYKQIKDCYKKASVDKRTKYAHWITWFEKMGSTKYGIYTYNKYVFTMGGIIDYVGEKYYVYITPTRNELIPMEH